MKKILFSILSLGVLISSCVKDDPDCQPTHVMDPVKFSAFMEDFIMQSRSVKMDWSQSDKMAIFSDIAVKKDGSTSTSSITYTRGAAEGEWTPPGADEQWYFADAVIQHNFYSYYPEGTATSYTGVKIPDISGQDGTKSLATLKEENDFLRGTAVATEQMQMASLQMLRVFSIINFNIKLKQDAFIDNAATLTDVKLISTESLPLANPTSADTATVDLSSGHVTCVNGLSTVTLHPASGIALTPTAVSVPIKIYPQHSTIQVQFTVGGKTSTVRTLSTTNFVGGRIYSYLVELGADLTQVGIGDPVIFNWLDVPGDTIRPIIPN